MAIILGNSAAPESYLGQYPGAVYFDTLGNARAPTEDGTLVSASVWVKDGAATGRGVKIGLYDADLNLLATADITDTSGAEGFKTALLDTPVAVTTAQTYRFGTITQTRNPPTIGTGGSRFWQYDDGLSYANPLPNPPAVDGSTGTPGDLRIYFSTAGAATPSITAADRINSEGETVTFTLANNAAAATAATLNGTDVGTLTDQGSGVYSYTAPLIADDDTADLVVSVDGTTASTTIAYANSYDRDQLTHPATEAEYSENSLSYPNAYATTQPYEWKVIADANASVVTINWNALEADDGFHKDVSSYAAPVANGSTTVTLGVFVPETGDSWQFDRTITVSDGSVEVSDSERHSFSLGFSMGF